VANNSHSDKKGRYGIKPVTIETVDQSVFDYFDKHLAPEVDVERGRKKVPVQYATGERWKLIRKNKFRDENGTLILPLISVRRTDIDRTRGFGGMAQEVPEITVSKVLHPKTSLFQNRINQRKKIGFPEVKKDKVVREYLTIPFPDFFQIYYEISIWAQYHQQMNQILENIFYNYDHLDSFVMPVEYDGKEPKGDSYYFVGFREGNISPGSNTEEFTGQERIIKYSYTIRTPVYLMLDPKSESLSYGKDGKGKKVVYKHQSSIDIKLGESVISFEDFEKLFG